MSSIFKDQTIGTFEQLAALVQPFRKDGAWIFRGMPDGTYPLMPRIGRPGARKELGFPRELPYSATEEETMMKHFIRSAAPYVQHVPRSRLEWLAIAQHHGLATRLLDWTESLLVAAYFAVEDAKISQGLPTIFAVRDIPVAKEKFHNRLEKLPGVALYFPPHLSPRIPSQSSVFTVHRLPDKAFKPKRMVRIAIAKAPLTMKLNLHACGIHRASLFPDIDGLANYRSWLYKWGVHKRLDPD